MDDMTERHERSEHPQSMAEHAARDRQMAHAYAVVADLIGFAQAVDTTDSADAYVTVALRAADATVQCDPEQREGFTIGLLAAAVTAAALRVELNAHERRHDIGWAVDRMREGHKVRRGHEHPGWAAGVVVDIGPPDAETDEPFMRIKSIDGRRRPWTPGQWDLLAEDWVLAETGDQQ